MGTRTLVDENYAPDSIAERIELMIFEHVLCQIDNLISHPFIFERVLNWDYFVSRLGCR
jgi:hypothetical protein